MSQVSAGAIDISEVRKWKRYPAYKDSGVEWLGEIPAHWKVWKVSHAFKRIGSGTTPASNDATFYDGDIPWITTSELRENIINEAATKITKAALKQHSALSLYPPGTLLIAMYGATIGRLGILGIDACTNQACCALAEPVALDTKFTFYWLWMRRQEIIIMSSGGGQPNINQEKIRSLRIPAPNLSEQQEIASFLDRETAKLDALIAKKEQLIERLQEKRTALISHAVTKGLNPDVPMKHSGVDIYPNVPRHWTVLRLRYLCKKVADGPHFSPAYVNEGEGIMFLSARNVKVDGWSLDDAKYISEEDYKEFCKRVVPEVGDILYTKGGTTGIARVVDLTFPFHVWVHIAVLKLKREKVNPYFLAYALSSVACYGQSQIYTRGATNNDLGLTRLINIVLAIPPEAEQQAIASFLDRETAKLDALIAKTRTSIEQLKEYRTALISSAVTGKIDVREFANAS